MHKIQGQNIIKNDTECIIYTHHRSDRPYMKHENFTQTDCQVTHTP